MLAHAITLVESYKYVILFPIAFLEGHIITIISGFLVRLGYLNFIPAGLVIASGNLLGDILFYWLGYTKGEKFALKYGKYIGINETNLETTKAIFMKHHEWILLISKLTNGLGLAIVILFTAGMSKIPFRKYLLLNIIGELAWTGLLLTLGYFFGHLYARINNVFSGIGFVLVVAVLVFLFVRILNYLRAKIV
jgi:membrane-associated protein